MRLDRESTAIHQFDIIDDQAHKDWEALMGFKIPYSFVRVPRAFYVKHVERICKIQMQAVKRRNETLTLET